MNSLTKEEAREYQRIYRLACPEISSGTAKRSNDRCCDRIRSYRKAYHALNGDAIRAKSKRWYEENKDRVKAREVAYRDRRNKRWRERCSQEPGLKVRNAIKCRLYLALQERGGKKTLSVLKLLGCSVESFQVYIESKFEVGMSWQNYGQWELDHIMPCAIFDLMKLSHQHRCFHFSNYQPLWKADNQSKHAKVLSDQFQLI